MYKELLKVRLGVGHMSMNTFSINNFLSNDIICIEKTSTKLIDLLFNRNIFLINVFIIYLLNTFIQRTVT